jgi:hypothetical protein
MRAIAIALLLAACFAGDALAFDTRRLGQWGSLFLVDIMPLIRTSPRLEREVADAVKQAQADREDVVCIGARFPGVWTHLGGERAAPYSCEIGARLLLLRARVRIKDRKGRVLEGITAASMRRAARIEQDRLSWRWEKSEAGRSD